MTLLYRPVEITSAEQAEALPVRTPIIIGPFVAMRSDSESFWGMSFTDGDYTSTELVKSFPDYDLIALVPIEAEEIWGIADADGTTYRAQSEEHARRWQKTMGTALAQRYITPWREADQ